MVTLLISIFGGLVLIVKFIKSIIVKYLVHTVILGLQFAVTATTITFVSAFYFFTITALISVFNLGIEIIEYASNSGIQGVSCLANLVNCIGLASAMENGFALMYSALSSIVIFHLFKFTFGAMKMIMNEIFKLGVLLGQAVN